MLDGAVTRHLRVNPISYRHFASLIKMLVSCLDSLFDMLTEALERATFDRPATAAPPIVLRYPRSHKTANVA